MLSKIISVIEKSPGIKAKAIAKELNVDTKPVNALLYENSAVFVCDESYQWSLLKEQRLHVEFASDCWVGSELFERAVKAAGSPLEANASAVVFVVPQGCKLLLDAAARLMAMCNQLAHLKKTAIVDFTESKTTLRYLNRMGFFDHLANSVQVLPNRPSESRAAVFKGQNDKVVEFGSINPLQLDDKIPELLMNSFVQHTSKRYQQPAFTILAELYGNVRDHSNSPIFGFVALQCYKKGKPPHIQTVISDSGAGIAGTLMPVLNVRYPELAKEIASHGSAAGPMLVREIFKKGRISSVADDRGLGLKASGDAAAKFNAKITLRQESFEVRLQYKNGKLDRFDYELDMPKLLGTHICFDFLLD